MGNYISLHALVFCNVVVVTWCFTPSQPFIVMNQCSSHFCSKGTSHLKNFVHKDGPFCTRETWGVVVVVVVVVVCVCGGGGGGGGGGLSPKQPHRFCFKISVNIILNLEFSCVSDG